MLNLGMIGNRKVLLIRQTELAECGFASLAMILNYHGLSCDLNFLRRRYAPSLRGSTLANLVSVAEDFGLASRAVKVRLDELPMLATPCILHWDMSHFVVLERTGKRGALVHDPAGQSRWVPLDEVSRRFSGVALELRPTIDFRPQSVRERLKLTTLLRGTPGLWKALAHVLGLSLILQAYILIAPLYARMAIDDAVPSGDTEFLALLLLFFTLFLVINFGAALLRSFLLLATGAQLGFSLSLNVAYRLFRLPVPWFERRHIGDILSRFQSIIPIQQGLTGTSVAAILDGILTVFLLIMMFVFSPLLGLVSLCAAIIVITVRAYFFPLQRQAQEAVIVTGAKAQTNMIESIRGIATLRLSRKEGARLAVWQSALTDNINDGFKFLRMGAWLEVITASTFALDTILSTYIGAAYIIGGTLSLGTFFAVLVYKAQFLVRLTSFLDQATQFNMLRLHTERLSDIVLAEEEAGSNESASNHRPFEGAVELRSVQFRYSPTDPAVLDGANLTIRPGEHVAITGPSGEGKSTTAKLMAGLIEPSQGEVLIDGIPLASFGRRGFQNQIAVVLQDDHLFTGTVAENIALFDEQPSAERIEAAATAAAIHQEVMRMPMRYETLIGDMGSALSGGQRQRILLARALYRNPKLLIVDEGTSHLDADLEAQINSAIRSLNITRVIIAHRQETIRSADRIVRVQDGKIVDQDTVEPRPDRQNMRVAGS